MLLLVTLPQGTALDWRSKFIPGNPCKELGCTSGQTKQSVKDTNCWWLKKSFHFWVIYPCWCINNVQLYYIYIYIVTYMYCSCRAHAISKCHHHWSHHWNNAQIQTSQYNLRLKIKHIYSKTSRPPTRSCFSSCVSTHIKVRPKPSAKGPPTGPLLRPEIRSEQKLFAD